MSVAQPDYPAVSDYPTAGPHAALLDAGHALFLAELASNEGWEDAGEREEVQLYRKADPTVSTDASEVPRVLADAQTCRTPVSGYVALPHILIPGRVHTPRHRTRVQELAADIKVCRRRAHRQGRMPRHRLHLGRLPRRPPALRFP